MYSTETKTSMVTKYIKRLFLILVAAVLVALVIFYFKSDAVLAKVISMVEQRTHTEITYQKSNIRIFDHFPNLSVSVSHIEMDDGATGERLFLAERLSTGFNPFRLILNRKVLKINNLNLEAPNFYFIKDKDGNSNWQKIIESSENEDSGSLQTVSLGAIRISEGKLLYRDLITRTTAGLENLNYQGRFEVAADSIFHHGELNAILSAQIPPFFSIQEYAVAMSADARGNLNKNSYQFANSSFSLNDLLMIFSGGFNIEQSGIGYHISMESEEQDFENLLSLLRNFREVGEKIQDDTFSAAGNFSIKGSVKGNTAGENYPIYDFTAHTTNGLVKFSGDTPTDTKIGLHMTAHNSNTLKPFERIKVADLQIVQGEEYLSGELILDHIGESVFVDYDVNAQISDLGNFDRFSIYDLKTGQIDLKSAASFDLTAINENVYDKVSFSIDAEASGLEVLIDSAYLTLEELKIQGHASNMSSVLRELKYIESDMSGTAQITKPLDILSSNAAVDLTADLESRFLNINSFLSGRSDTDTVRFYPELRGSLALSCDQMIYTSYPISNVLFEGTLADDILQIRNLNGKIQNSDFEMSGSLSGMNQYLRKKGSLQGVLDLRSEEIHLGELEALHKDTTLYVYTSTDDAIFENFDIQVISSSDLLTYKNAYLKDNLASINLFDNTLNINDLTSRSFDGSLQMQGAFAFDKASSLVALKADFSNVSISECLGALPFFRQLSYPLSFIEGHINTTLTLESLLDEDYNLILPEVNAFGLLETLDGNLIGFKPAEVLNEFLGVQESKELVIKRSKNWVTIKDGWVQVDEFAFNIGQNKFKVKGAHSLENELNYAIFAEVPSAAFAKINLKDRIGNELYEKINRYRDVGEGSLGLYFQMTGTFGQPILRLNEVDIISAGKAAIIETIDEAKDSIRTTLDTLRNEVETQVRDTIEALTDKVEEKVGEAIDSAKAVIAGQIEEHLDTVMKSQLDSLGNIFLDETGILDSLKKEIFELKDIFKRRKSR